MIKIPTKCYNCQRPIGYIQTDTRESTIRDLITAFGLILTCEKCIQIEVLLE
jgi:hypothetical protein